jgi:hypothetical protein
MQAVSNLMQVFRENDSHFSAVRFAEDMKGAIAISGILSQPDLEETDEIVGDLIDVGRECGFIGDIAEPGTDWLIDKQHIGDLHLQHWGSRND